MTKAQLNFKKPSGESRITEDIKQSIAQGEIQRFNFDMPKELAVKLKIESAKQGKSMRDIVVDAITQILK